jgi:ribosomal-protein-alanine N-acetyltransferase
MTDNFRSHIGIRKTVKGYIDAIFQIEQEQFLHPWKKEFFYRELSHNIAWFYVAENTKTKEIAGYILFWIIEETLELHDIAVKGSYKKKGIGRLMMEFMMETARDKGVEEMFLEVRQSNVEAVRFYEKFGFMQIDVRKNYYNNPVENALVYRLLMD